MIDKTTHVPVLVRDQDKALEFYVGTLGFEKRQDYGQKGKPRWLTVAPPGSDVELALAKGEFLADPRAEEGYRITLATSDCRGEFARLKARGVPFREAAPVETPFGIVATFADPDGNRFTLRESAKGR